nr:hypothetical protein [Tanacetum cinerariifolium]
MDLESSQNNAVAKLPLLKQGDYEMWKLRIKQYFQVQDYALWDVIENGNSFNPVPRVTANVDGTSTSIISGLVTTEEKAQKKNDVKARSMLLMALPNEHLLTFSQYKDAKTLFETIQARFSVSFAEYESKKECRSLRSQQSRPRNQDSSRKTMIVEDTSSKAMVVIDGAGFDWSYMTNDEVPTNMALTAFSDLEVHNSKTCSNTCLKSFETLKNQYDNLRIELNKSEFDLAAYKRGLASVEEQLVFYKKNEVVFCDQIVILKREASFRESKIIALNLQLEKLKKEKESNQIKIDNFENTSKSLDKLIGSQITDNSKTSLGFTSYNVATSPTGLFAPLTIELSSFGLEEFKQHEFESYGPKDNCDFHDKMTVQKPVLKTMEKETGQREVRPIWNNAIRVNHQNFYNLRRNFGSTTVLTKSGIVPISTARQSSSRAATPVSTTRPINTAAPKPIVNVAKTRQNTFQKPHSLSKSPFHQQTTLKNGYLVNTAKVKSVNTVNTVNTAKGKNVTSVVWKQGTNVVKSSACWVWRPKIKGDPQAALRDTGIFDSGCSRHMTGSKSFLSDYQEYDGGFVAFVGSSKGGKKLMCDKKNSVLFTETECLILSPNFKLPDENQVLLKVPRKNNMYSFDLKNVVPSKGLTCLFPKATNDESNLWHMRLGHIKFKTMNKLLKGNLVRDKKDETSRILKDFITRIENQLNHKVKIIRCDNKTEFKNYEMNQFCGIKGIKREFSNARTPQQNRVAERKNRTLIENMVLVTKPHNKTSYELLIGRSPIISFMRPFGCPVTILNTLDYLEKFNGKADEGFLVG